LVVCFAFSQTAQAVTPPPDGGYPGGNTAEGQSALLNLTSGAYNTAVGWFSLGSNTNSQFNTGLGAGTLFANNGDNNTAVGTGALLNNSTGGHNTANGTFALFTNSEGTDNTAIGDGALLANTADDNTAVGHSPSLAIPVVAATLQKVLPLSLSIPPAPGTQLLDSMLFLVIRWG